MKSSLKIRTCAKLEPSYCGPFKILERIGLISYRLVLHPSDRIHYVFHVSFLERYFKDYNHVID